MNRSRKNERFTMVLSKEMLNGIDRAVKLGYSMNRSDFIRASIGEKLKDLSILKDLNKNMK